jgi:hypothetical protein
MMCPLVLGMKYSQPRSPTMWGMPPRTGPPEARAGMALPGGPLNWCEEPMVAGMLDVTPFMVMAPLIAAAP